MQTTRERFLSATRRLIETVGTVFMFLEYLFSWREAIMSVIGAWCLGFLEGIIVATIMAITVCVLAGPITSILKSLIELGNKKDRAEHGH